MFRSWVECAKSYEKTIIKRQKIGILSLSFIAIFLGILFEYIGGIEQTSYAGYLLITAGLLSLILAIIGVSDHYPNVLKGYVESKKRLIVDDLARDSKRSDLLDEYVVDWSTYEVTRDSKNC